MTTALTKPLIDAPADIHQEVIDHLRQVRAGIQARVDQYSEQLKAFPRRPNGLVPDAVRQSLEYQRTKRNFDQVFQELRTFNGRLTSDQKRALRKTPV